MGKGLDEVEHNGRRILLKFSTTSHLEGTYMDLRIIDHLLFLHVVTFFLFKAQDIKNIKDQKPVDLVLCLLLGILLGNHLTDIPLDPGLDILYEVFGGAVVVRH